jgi:DNA-binding response OmpR family regulator
LEQAGFTCLSASNGLEGLQKAQAFEPDVIVLGLRLPKMDGWEVCKRLRAKRNVGIIVLTALLNEAVKDEIYRLGADQVLTKPLVPRP